MTKTKHTWKCHLKLHINIKLKLSNDCNIMSNLHYAILTNLTNNRGDRCIRKYEHRRRQRAKETFFDIHITYMTQNMYVNKITSAAFLSIDNRRKVLTRWTDHDVAENGTLLVYITTLSVKRNLSLLQSVTHWNPMHQSDSYLDTD